MSKTSEISIVSGLLERFSTRKGDDILIDGDPDKFWWAFKNFWGKNVTITITENITMSTDMKPDSIKTIYSKEIEVISNE